MFLTIKNINITALFLIFLSVATATLAHGAKSSKTETISNPAVTLSPAIKQDNNVITPANWSFPNYSGERGTFFVAKHDKKTYLSKPYSLYLGSKTINYSAYWGQNVKVKPGKTYFVRVRFKAINAKILIWLTGHDGNGHKFNKRIYFLQGKPSFLVPVFLNPKKTGGISGASGWQTLERAITIPKGMTQISIKMGSYFGSGKIWFDDIYVGQGVPTMRLDVNNSDELKKVTVRERKTQDVVFKHEFSKKDKGLHEILPDTLANKSYILTVEWNDGSETTRFYPSKYQIYSR